MKRYYIKIMLLFFLFSTLFSVLSVKADLPLQGKVIVVDAGHGGLDPGSVYKNIYEKNINLNISLFLRENLSKMGATVVLTRDSDADLSNGVKNHRKKADFDERIKLINNKYTDLYISIHLNYLADSRYYGAQVFYNKKNQKLAEKIQEYLNKHIKGSRDAKKIPSSTYMYSKLTKPGVLIECGFLSNDIERSKLITKEYQEKFASILAQAIADYYN